MSSIKIKETGPVSVVLSTQSDILSFGQALFQKEEASMSQSHCMKAPSWDNLSHPVAIIGPLAVSIYFGLDRTRGWVDPTI